MQLTDYHRRVLANLSIPRSAQEVARQVAADAHSPFDPNISFAQLANEVALYLRDLEEAGYAKNLGVVEGAEHAVDVVTGDGDVPDLHPEKAQSYQDRMTGKDRWKLSEGDLWYFTTAGFEALTAG